jgi:hypothetical protein
MKSHRAVLITVTRSLTTIRGEITTSAHRLGWLLVLGTIPVGLVGLLLEHTGDPPGLRARAPGTPRAPAAHIVVT